MYQQSHLQPSPSHLSQTGGCRGPHKGEQTRPHAQLQDRPDPACERVYRSPLSVMKRVHVSPAVAFIDDSIRLMGADYGREGYTLWCWDQKGVAVPVTHFSASVFLQVWWRPEPLASFSPLLVDGLPGQMADSKTKVQFSAREPGNSWISFQAHLRWTI